MKLLFARIAIFGQLALFGASSSILRAQSAEEIVAKAIAARGGAERIKAVQSERLSGKIRLGPGAEGPFSIELKRPGKLHAEFTLQGQTLIRTYDGKTGWVFNPFTQNKEAQPMSAEDMHSISEESDYDGPLVDYLAKGHQIAFVGKEERDGQPVYRLKLTQKNGDVRFYLFDASNFQLLKGETTRSIDGKTYPVETFFSDYRDVEGLIFSFKIESRSEGQDQQQSITIDKIDLNVPIDDSHFAKPQPSVKPTSSHYLAPSSNHRTPLACGGGSPARNTAEQRYMA